MAEEKQPTLKTPFGVCSYPHLDKPWKSKDDADDETKKPRYSLLIGFTPTLLAKHPEIKEQLAALKASAKQCAIDTFGESAMEMVKSKKIKWPFKRQDDEDEDSAIQFEPGTLFISAWSYTKPGVADRYEDPNNPGRPVVIADDKIAATVYAGCIVRASVRAFPFKQTRNKGVSFYLANVQKVGEGVRLDGRKAASEEFDALEDAADLPEDEAPRNKKSATKRRPVDDEDDDPPPRAKKRPAPVEDEDDDEPPPRKKRPTPVEDDEDDEPPPRKKKVVVDEDEDDEPPPRKKRAVVDDEDDDEPPRRKKRPARDVEDVM